MNQNAVARTIRPMKLSDSKGGIGKLDLDNNM